MLIGGLTIAVLDAKAGKKLTVSTAPPGGRGGFGVEASLGAPKDLQDLADFLAVEAEAWLAGVVSGGHRLNGPDPYKTLGVHRTAPWELIAKIFKMRAQKEHPDKGGDATAWKAVQSAYTELNARRKEVGCV